MRVCVRGVVYSVSFFVRGLGAWWCWFKDIHKQRCPPAGLLLLLPGLCAPRVISALMHERSSPFFGPVL